MRNKLHEQLSIVEPDITHEHARELQAINELLKSHPIIAELIYKDLIRDLKNPELGRQGLMSGEQVFKVLLIKQMNEFSYEMLSFHLADSRSYKFFCGFGFVEKTPSAKTLQRDIKKLRPETLEAIHKVILTSKAALKVEKGTKVRTDCTVVESNIHHPTDSSLLEDSVRVLCRLTQKSKMLFGSVVSDHSRRAKRRLLGIRNAKNQKIRKPLYRDLLKITNKTINDAERVAIELIKRHPKNVEAKVLSAEIGHYVALARMVVSQTERRVINGEKVDSSEKIVSIFEEHTDIIVKDRRDTFYGHKIALTGGSSGLLTDVVVEKGNPADTTLAVKMILRQKEIYGKVPRQSSFDGGFASKDNLKDIKKLGVKDVCFAKKRGIEIDDMTKSVWVYKRLRDFRAGIEGMISYLKRSFGLGRCTWRGFESFKAYTWASVLTANLLLLARRQMA